MNIDDLKKDIAKDPIEYEGGRASYLWIAETIYNSSYKEGVFSTELPVIVLHRDNNIKVYFSCPPEILSAALEFFIKNNGTEKIEEEIKNRYQEISRIADEYSNETGQKLLEGFQKCLNEFNTFHQYPIYIRKVDRAIRAEIKRRFADKETDILAHCNTSERHGFFIQEDLTIAGLGEKVESKIITELLDIDLALNEIYKEFFHITLGYYNERPRDISFYKERLEVILSGGARTFIEETKSEHQKKLDEKNQYLEITQDEETKDLLNLIGTASWLKDCYKFYVNKAQSSFESLWQAASKTTGHEADYLKSLTREDLFKVLSGEDKETQNTTTVFIGKTNSYLIRLVGEEATKFESEYLLEKKNDTSTLKGRPACRGNVQGKVVIVLSFDDFAKVQDGDILVVQNTSPDFVVILKRVIAVIAEEGGITAHVSVITREMNIPCVVGVRNVTSILKDGDVVEVDANMGIVKIIS